MQKRRINNLCFYLINDSFGCFIEYNYIGGPYFVNLVEFDFINKIFRKIQIVELTSCSKIRIFVDEYDPSKFILIWEDSDGLHIQSFRLVNGTVNIENATRYERRTFLIDHYFDRCVYRCLLPRITWNNVS
jgi:hypothetical protein